MRTTNTSGTISCGAISSGPMRYLLALLVFATLLVAPMSTLYAQDGSSADDRSEAQLNLSAGALAAYEPSAYMGHVEDILQQRDSSKSPVAATGATAQAVIPTADETLADIMQSPYYPAIYMDEIARLTYLRDATAEQK